MSTLNVSNITDGTTTVGTSYVVNGSAKMWVSLNDAAVVKDSFNVSSASDSGVGKYTVNFTNAFSNSDYANAMIAVDADGNGYISGKSTTSVRYNNYTTTFTDAPTEGMIMGDLA
jgi:hypothetical protein